MIKCLNCGWKGSSSALTCIETENFPIYNTQTGEFLYFEDEDACPQCHSPELEWEIL